MRRYANISPVPVTIDGAPGDIAILYYINGSHFGRSARRDVARFVRYNVRVVTSMQSSGAFSRVLLPHRLTYRIKRITGRITSYTTTYRFVLRILLVVSHRYVGNFIVLVVTAAS